MGNYKRFKLATPHEFLPLLSPPTSITTSLAVVLTPTSMPANTSTMATTGSEPLRRASLACQNCRQRKVKHIQPGQRCTPCQRTSSHCAFNRNGDRRKSGSRKHIETLEQRIHSLEALLTKTANQPTEHEEDALCSIRNVSPPQESCETRQISINHITPSTPDKDPLVSTHTERAFNDLGSAQDTTWVKNDIDMLPLINMDNDRPETLSDGAIHILGGGVREEVGRGSPEGGEEPEYTTTPESSRNHDEGSCALGPTSQSHILSPVICQPMSASDELSGLGIDMDINSAQLRNRLLQSFFRYQILWVSLIDEDVFNMHRENGVSSFWYSPFLENVMLACATRLSTSSAVRSLGHKYASQSNAGILEAIEKPSAASLQGLLLLSEYEVTNCRDRVGWMLCGMASRMLVDIGFHDRAYQNASPATSRGPLQLFCATISYEGIWCMYLGRPSAIPRALVKAAAISCRNYDGPDAAILNAWMGLCVPMADICDLLNSEPCLGPEARAALSRLEADIHTWCKNLPPGMAYDESCVPDLNPTAYGIHMQFCKVKILIHKALMRSPISQSWEDCQIPMTRGADDHDESEQIIYKNAIQIIRLLLTYKQLSGTEKIPSVMLDNINLALTVLITQFLAHPSQVTDNLRDLQWLRLAINTMNTLQSHFPVVTRMLSTLRPLVDGTPLADIFPPKSSSQLSRPSAPSPTDFTFMPITEKCKDIPNAPTGRHLAGGHTLSDFMQVETDTNYGYDPMTWELSSLDRQWLHRDPEELTSSLLSWPSLQLASLWMPQSTAIPDHV